MQDLLLLILVLFSSLGGTPAGAQDSGAGAGAGIEPRVESEAAPAVAAEPGGLLVVGDSLAVGAGPPLSQALPGWRIEELARTSKPTAEGVEEVRRRAGRLPGVLAISLGTNDDPSAVGTFESQVEAILEQAGPGRCVVWANIVRPPYGGVSYAGFNRALTRLAAAHPNLRLVDWAGLVSANPSWLAPDGVHATSAGYAGRGRAIADAVRACAGAGRGTQFGTGD